MVRIVAARLVANLGTREPAAQDELRSDHCGMFTGRYPRAQCNLHTQAAKPMTIRHSNFPSPSATARLTRSLNFESSRLEKAFGTSMHENKRRTTQAYSEKGAIRNETEPSERSTQKYATRGVRRLNIFGRCADAQVGRGLNTANESNLAACTPARQLQAPKTLELHFRDAII